MGWNQDDEWQGDDGAWRRQLSRTSSNYSCSCDCFNDHCDCTQNGERVESCDQSGSDSFGPSHHSSRPNHRRHRHSSSSSNYDCSCDCYDHQCECMENGERVESCDQSSQGGWWNQDDEWQRDGAWRRQLSRTSSNSCSCGCDWGVDDACMCMQNGKRVASCDS